VLGSLRAKLIASYVVVVVLTLILAGSGFAYVIRLYQTQLRLNQLADLAVPLAIQVRSLQRAGVSSPELNQFLQDQAADLDVRILLLDPNHKVTLDTSTTFLGKTLPVGSDEMRRLGGEIQMGNLTMDGSGPLTYIALVPRTDRPAGSGSSALTAPPPSEPPITLVLAEPETAVTTAWLQLAPSLIEAALAALVVAVVVAIFLARSISRPLAQVSAASERMAKGDFDQFIPVRGSDEVSHLADSFNVMAREVGQMHRTMRDFLANVSHELRTPLTSIEGFSTAMSDGTIRSPEEFRDAARIIEEEADRMRRLVEDLLYLSKIESGQIAINRSRLDLSDLLRSCVRQVQPQAEHAHLNVELETHPVPPILADGHRLQQVFVNLLDNAVKHTPPTGTIEVKAYPLTDRPLKEPSDLARQNGHGPWIAVDVHNSGSYISPEHAGRIFERFYQVDQSRAGNVGGSGLGLAIVQEIVQAHHGKVSVASDPKSGTTFTVVLPAA
jgi:signal transduction histidine kinase